MSAFIEGRLQARRLLHAKISKIPVRWRERLPAAVDLYGILLVHLSEVDAEGYATAACPLHDGASNAAMRVKVESSRGGWVCHECGRGDMIEFVMRLLNVGFVDAVRYLVFEVAVPDRLLGHNNTAQGEDEWAH